MLQPQIIRRRRPVLKDCTFCKTERAGDEFIESKSWFYHDGVITVCNTCIKNRMIEGEWNWELVDKFCQTIDIPFIPKEFERLREINGDDVFPIYARVFQEEEFDDFGWSDYFERFKELRQLKLVNKELPEIHDAFVEEMQLTWGANYDEESCLYLEGLYNGMKNNFNINGALQVDQARKLCKISLDIDKKIRAGTNIDKEMASYDRMIKTAEFTPKNSKGDTDFDSFAEVALWLEKRGWINEYFDGVSRDVVDEVQQNLQAFNQRLYTNETNIAEEIETRIRSLRMTSEEVSTENFFETDEDYNIESYENDGYDGLIKEEFLIDEEE